MCAWYLVPRCRFPFAICWQTNIIIIQQCLPVICIGNCLCFIERILYILLFLGTFSYSSLSFTLLCIAAYFLSCFKNVPAITGTLYDTTHLAYELLIIISVRHVRIIHWRILALPNIILGIPKLFSIIRKIF